MAMKLALGPLQYFWDRQTVLDFYDHIATAPVDIVYLGETVCAKRRALRFDDWAELAGKLEEAGKEVVFSTLALVEAESDLAQVKRVCWNNRFPVEANDMAAVSLIDGRTPFIVGPHINTYNAGTLALLAEAGANRWVMPMELDRDSLAALQQARPAGMETEVFVFGRLPLAFSARCFTARAHNIAKDECGFCCKEDVDGMLLSTREHQPFLNLNGIQVQSALTYNLVGQLPELDSLGVDIVRLSPQAQGMPEIIDLVHQVIAGDMDAAETAGALQPFMPVGPCDGYWYGDPGLGFQEEEVPQELMRSQS